jgi:hypothetical protein
LLLDKLKSDEDIFILVNGFQDYHKQFYNLLGINEKRIIVYDDNYFYYSKNLYFPTPISIPFSPSFFFFFKKNKFKNKFKKKFLKKLFLGEQLLKVFDYFVPKRIPLNQRNKIIFISRINSRERKLLNWEIIYKRLKQRFEKNDLEVIHFIGYNQTVQQQIELFKSANMIISPLGAGLG